MSCSSFQFGNHNESFLYFLYLPLFPINYPLDTTLAPAQIVANEGENATFVCSPFITAARPTLFSTDPGSMNIELVPSSDNRVLSIDNVNVGRTYVWLRVNRTLDHLRKFYCDVNSVRSNASTLTVNCEFIRLHLILVFIRLHLILVFIRLHLILVIFSVVTTLTSFT